MAFETVRSWLSALERLYAAFRVSPYGPPRIKAVKKSQKLYLWDWSRVENEGARAENLVLFHLLRLVHWLEDVHGDRVELLRFFRGASGEEVDAVVLRNRRPWMAVEVMLEPPLSSVHHSTSYDVPVIERVVFIKLKPDHANDETRAAVAQTTRSTLPDAEGVRALRVATAADARTRRQWDLCLQVVLDDLAAIERYRTDRVHRAYVDVFLKPMLEKIHVYNFERDAEP